MRKTSVLLKIIILICQTLLCLQRVSQACEHYLPGRTQKTNMFCLMSSSASKLPLLDEFPCSGLRLQFDQMTNRICPPGGHNRLIKILVITWKERLFWNGYLPYRPSMVYNSSRIGERYWFVCYLSRIDSYSAYDKWLILVLIQCRLCETKDSCNRFLDFIECCAILKQCSNKQYTNCIFCRGELFVQWMLCSVNENITVFKMLFITQINAVCWSSSINHMIDCVG